MPKKGNTSARDRAQMQVETTKRVIKRAEARRDKAQREVEEIDTQIADLKERLAWEQQQPALRGSDITDVETGPGNLAGDGVEDQDPVVE